MLAAAKETFDEFLFCIDLCKKKLKLKSINTLSYANIAWASVHGLSTLLIDGQIKVTDKTGGMPALFTKNEIQDSENIRKFIHSSIKILIDFMKSNKS